MIPFFAQRILVTGGGGGGITGYDTALSAIRSTTTGTVYSGTISSVQSDDLVVFGVVVMGNGITTDLDATLFTVTLNGVDMSPYLIKQSTLVKSVFPHVSIWAVKASIVGTGNLALSVTLNQSSRALAAPYLLLKGFNTTTPTNGTGGAESLNADVSSLTSPNAFSPAQAGNVILCLIDVKGGDITNLAVGTDFTLCTNTYTNTGTNASSDVTYAFAYCVASDTNAKSGTWTWTSADRVVAPFIEIVKA